MPIGVRLDAVEMRRHTNALEACSSIAVSVLRPVLLDYVTQIVWCVVEAEGVLEAAFLRLFDVLQRSAWFSVQARLRSRSDRKHATLGSALLRSRLSRRLIARRSGEPQHTTRSPDLLALLLRGR